MARIELSNIGGGGGTTLSLTTTGTSGAATLAGSVLNIPVYQGQLTLTTTGTSGAATLSGDILNIPQYSGGGGTPAGSAGQVQFNSTPAGSFAASANLAWDNSSVRLNIGAPSAPTGRLNIKGSGALTTTNFELTNSSNNSIFKVQDNSNITIGNPAVNTGTNILASGSEPTAAEILLAPSSGNKTVLLELLTSGTNTNMPSVILYDKNAVTSGANVGFFGRSGFTGLSSNVLYFGSVVAGASAANSLHLGFNVSNTTLTRFQAMQIWNSGNVIMQNGGTYTDSGYKLDIISASSTHALRTRAPNANSGTDALIVQNSTPSDLYRIEANGKISYFATNTAAGATGAQTINRPSGTVNFGIGASSLVVTNSLCTTSSIVFATVRTNDATAQIKNVVPAAGSFTINLSAAATAETSVGFFIIN